MLRQHIGGQIGNADSDNVLAAYLWVLEGQAAKLMLDAIAEDEAWITDKHIERCRAHLESESPFGKAWTCTRRELVAALEAHLNVCETELNTVRSLRDKAASTFDQLRAMFGTDIMSRFTDDADAGGLLNVISDSWNASGDAHGRVGRSLRSTNRRMTELEALETSRLAFLESGKSVSRSTIDHFEGPELERLTAELLRRDGLTVLRDSGGPDEHAIDVVALCPDERKVVVQCKIRHKGPIGPQIVYAVNGTARPHYQADIAIIVTNSHFSSRAIGFAASQGIHLMDGHQLECWATWGDSIFDLLDLHSPRVDGRDQSEPTS
ncbi:restriction endonuclease [Nocardia fusca]|uniref:restriction endonuclease n=1 Tax=Nocardia fusca TaxID=941183 RepID=UPI000B251374|nr:restriction endonuclease [Nocardia fusca]